MKMGDGPASQGSRTPPPALDPFLETKLQHPPRRDDWVHRDRLLAALDRVGQHPVTLIAAPAGYGKTTLVTQWLDEARPRAAWVSLDAGDNDPHQFWTHVALALERAGGPAPRRRRAARWSRAPESMASAVVDSLAAATSGIVLVLDDFHFIQDVVCHAQVEYLIQHLPPFAHLVIATRADPGLRLGRLRVSGELVELRAEDLRFTTDEAETLFAHEAVALDQESLTALMQSTEGWPAGLYLATLSLNGRPDPAEFVRSFSGGNRFIGDYLTEEVLNHHPPAVREFITTISILDRFSPDLCDRVTGTTGSAALLHDLEHTNLFLVPLDGERRWYRFHHLFAAVAHRALEDAQPERLRLLHARAAEWFRSNDHVDEAIAHAIAADRDDVAAEVIQEHWLEYVDAGRLATVLSWVDSLGDASPAAEPAVSVTAAWLAALVGDQGALRSRLDRLEPYASVGPLPDGSHSVGSAVAMIEGLFGYGGPLPMLDGATRAAALEIDRGSPFHSIANVSLGHAAYVTGDLDRAAGPLSGARHNDHAPAIVRALGLAVEALVAEEVGDHALSWERAEQSMATVETYELRAVPQASLAYTALGAAQAAAGDTDDALETLTQGLLLRRSSSAHGPWGMIHHLLVHARVAAEAGRHGVARELMVELEPRLGVFSGGMDAMDARVAAVRRLLRTDARIVEGEALTSRELDILLLLDGTLSLADIAAKLFLSTNTVKTHARAVYRKLGAHNRDDAVRIGRQRELI